MKTFNISILILLMLTAFAAHSQTTKDTVCLPIADAKRILTRLEHLKADSVELIARNSDMIDLKNINSSQTRTISNLRLEVGAEQLKESTLNAEISAYAKEVSRQKRNKVFAIIGGIITTSASLYLFISK